MFTFKFTFFVLTRVLWGLNISHDGIFMQKALTEETFQGMKGISNLQIVFEKNDTLFDFDFNLTAGETFWFKSGSEGNLTLTSRITLFNGSSLSIEGFSLIIMGNSLQFFEGTELVIQNCRLFVQQITTDPFITCSNCKLLFFNNLEITCINDAPLKNYFLHSKNVYDITFNNSVFRNMHSEYTLLQAEMIENIKLDNITIYESKLKGFLEIRTSHITLLKGIRIIDNMIKMEAGYFIWVSHSSSFALLDFSVHRNLFQLCSFIGLYNNSDAASLQDSSFYNNYEFTNIMKVEMSLMLYIFNTSFTFSSSSSSSDSLIIGNIITIYDVKELVIKQSEFDSVFCLMSACLLVIRQTYDYMDRFNVISNSENSIEIQNTEFLRSKSFFISQNNLFCGSAIYLMVDGTVMLSNITMSQNIVFFQKNLFIEFGDSCIYSSAETTFLSIEKSFFEGNQAEASSNCIYFFGEAFSVRSSVFLNNKNLNDSFDNHRTFGASLNIGADLTLIEDNMFKNNKAYSGGGMACFLKYEYYLQEIILNRSLFFSNEARNGGAIYYHNYDMLTWLHFSFLQNEFFNNSAYKDGGAIYQSGIFVMDSFFQFKSCFFHENRAMRAGVLINSVLDHGSLVEECVFVMNYALSLWEGGGVIFNYENHEMLFTNCIFYGNMAVNQGGVGIYGRGVIHFERNFFFDNRAGKQGGCFITQRDSQLFMDENIIIKGEAEFQGGLVFLVNEAECTLNSNVISNFTSDKGGVISAFQEIKLIITNTSITYCYAGVGTLIYSFHNLIRISMVNITVENCGVRSLYAGSLVYIYSTDLSIDHITFRKNNGRIFEFSDSISNLTDVVIKEHECSSFSDSCVLMFFSRVTIDKILMKDAISGENADNFFHLDDSFIQIRSWVLINVTSNQLNQSYFINSKNSQLILEDLYFQSFVFKLILTADNVNYSLTNSFFYNYYQNLSISFIKSQGCLQIDLTNITLEGFQASENSVVQILSQALAEIYIANSFFFLNEGYNGGALFLINGNVKISQTLFLKNNGTIGGSCHFDNLLDMTSEIILHNNKFIENFAKESGGAYYWSSLLMKEEDTNFFLNNRAVHGADYASQPISILSLNTSETLISGNILQSSMVFILKDYYNQTCSSYSKGYALLSYENNEQSSLRKNIIGDKIAQIKEGKLSFPSLQFIAPPNSTQSLLLLTEELLIKKIAFPFYFRPCLQNEIYLQDLNICYECPYGSFSLHTSDTCHECPRNTECLGGDKIIINEGFWITPLDNNKKDLQLSLIYKCDILKLSCKGADVHEDLCASGYEGPKCGSCLFSERDKYYKNFENICLSCAEKPNIFLILLFSITVCLILMQTAFSVREGIFFCVNEDENEKSASLLTNNLMSYFLVISLIFDFEIEWPNLYNQMSDFLGIMNSMDQAMGYSDCLRDNLGMGLGYNATKMKITFTIFLYVLLFIGVTFFWVIWKIYKKRKSIRNFIILSFVALFKIIMHPVMKFLSVPFNCSQIGEKTYLNIDPMIECQSSDHFDIMIIIIIFGAIIFVIPNVFLFLELFINRKQLSSKMIRTRYLLFYLGYKKKFFFWEFVNVLKKCILIIITLKYNARPIEGLLLSIMALFVFTVLTMWVKPYKLKEMNYLEIYQHISGLFTFYGSLLYLNQNQGVQLLLIILIGLLNLSFIFLWFKLFYKYVKIFVAKGLRRISAFAKKTRTNVFGSNIMKSLRPESPVEKTNKRYAMGTNFNDKNIKKVIIFEAS